MRDPLSESACSSFFSKSFYLKISFRNSIRVPYSLDPHLNLNCLQDYQQTKIKCTELVMVSCSNKQIIIFQQEKMQHILGKLPLAGA